LVSIAVSHAEEGPWYPSLFVGALQLSPAPEVILVSMGQAEEAVPLFEAKRILEAFIAIGPGFRFPFQLYAAIVPGIGVIAANGVGADSAVDIAGKSCVTT
jgi:hypothetical protein